MQHFVEIELATDHPTAAGHFPGNPIIPGALLLDEVVSAIAGHTVGSDKIVIRAAKFFRLVRPGDKLCLAWHAVPGGAIKFECRVNNSEVLAAKGIIEIGPMPS